MKIILETNRLILREFSPIDAAHLYQLNLDPDVIMYTGNTSFDSVSEALEFVKNYADYKNNGYGRWAVIRKDNQEFIGWCGLKLHDLGFVDIGFRFLKSQWGRGYATESAMATLEYGFNRLGLIEIVGRAAQENIASVIVLKKLGMTYWKKEECHGIMDAHYYRISKSNYAELE